MELANLATTWTLPISFFGEVVTEVGGEVMDVGTDLVGIHTVVATTRATDDTLITDITMGGRNLSCLIFLKK